MKKLSIFLFFTIFLTACWITQGSKDDIKDNLYKDNKTITQKEAIQLQKNLDEYLQIRKIPKESIPNHAWINIDDLEKYIKWVKAKGAKDKLIVSGLRIYLGKYDSKDENFSLFLAPTGRPNISKSYFGSPSPEDPSEDSDLEYSPQNYVHTGLPPKTYPHTED